MGNQIGTDILGIAGGFGQIALGIATVNPVLVVSGGVTGLSGVASLGADVVAEKNAEDAAAAAATQQRLAAVAQASAEAQNEIMSFDARNGAYSGQSAAAISQYAASQSAFSQPMRSQAYAARTGDLYSRIAGGDVQTDPTGVISASTSGF